MNEQRHTMTGAWALNALTDAERAETERYLAENPEAAEEARTLAETAGQLALGAGPEAPPEHLKAQVMASIRNTRQERPLPGAPAGRPAGGPAPGADPAVVPLERYRRQRRASRILAVAAGVLLVAAGALGGAVAHQQAERAELQERLAAVATDQRRMAAILSADDAAIATAPVSTGGEVHLAYSAAEGLMAVSPQNLPPLPADRDYELWLISADGAEPAGLLTEEQASGRDAAMLSGSMEGVTHFGITVEPAGGSPQPTTEPILLREL